MFKKCLLRLLTRNPDQADSDGDSIGDACSCIRKPWIPLLLLDSFEAGE
jgi:hypothetical protein